MKCHAARLPGSLSTCPMGGSAGLHRLAAGSWLGRMVERLLPQALREPGFRGNRLSPQFLDHESYLCYVVEIPILEFDLLAIGKHNCADGGFPAGYRDQIQRTHITIMRPNVVLDVDNFVPTGTCRFETKCDDKTVFEELYMSSDSAVQPYANSNCNDERNNSLNAV